MNQKVLIKKDQLGNVIRMSSNPEYGYVVLQQSRMTIKNNWANNKKFTTLLHGTIEDLKEMGLEEMTSLSGNIVVRESVTPFDSINPDRDIKIAGDTGIVLCTEDGEPIYRKTVYDPSGTMVDELVPHANGDEIREALNVNKSYEDMAFEALAKEKKENDDAQLNMFPDEVDDAIIDNMLENNVETEEDVIDDDIVEDDTIFSLEG